jgi:hypothetical protein
MRVQTADASALTISPNASSRSQRLAGHVLSLVRDVIALAFPFAALYGMFQLVIAKKLITYPYDPIHPYNWNGGDYYVYVNMSFAHGNPQYVNNNPFLWRILVPKTVYLMTLAGVPFREGFWLITTTTLCLSTLLTFYLARGAGLTRISSAGAGMAFATLQWTVAYNVHNYFMVDTTTQAFIVAILLAGQRGKYIPAIVLATIGVLCKETIYLAIAVTVIQLTLPYLRPLSATLRDLMHGKLAAVAWRLPRGVWLRLSLLLALPLTMTVLLHLLLHPPPTQQYTALYVWQKYLGAHLAFGIPQTIIRSTVLTYGNYLLLALGGLALRLWPRVGWSGWSVLAAGLIILYSYMVSGDTQRLAIVGWPFVLVLSAVTVEELSRRLHLPLLLLWALVFASIWITDDKLNHGLTIDPISPFGTLFVSDAFLAQYAAPVAGGIALLFLVLINVALIQARRRSAARRAGEPASAKTIHLSASREPWADPSAAATIHLAALEYSDIGAAATLPLPVPASRLAQSPAAAPVAFQGRCSIILPAYNEEAVIAATVAQCLRAAERFCPNVEVIIVDDGSRDRTGAISDALAARDGRVGVIHNRPNRGYGGAVVAGFTAARGDWIFFMDSDGQFDINDIALLLDHARRHPDAAVIGYRHKRLDPSLRRLNAAGWKIVVRFVVGLRGIRDIDCAFKLLPAAVVHACRLQAQGAMINTELLIKMQRMHVPIIQIPVQHLPRRHGKATGADLRVIIHAFRELLRLRARLRQWQP